MGIENKTPYGDITISSEAIANVAGEAAIECYGVVGLASKNSLSDNINELLKKDDYKKGIYTKYDKRNGYAVDVYIFAAYGVKITEVVGQIQKKVRYDLERTFSIPFSKVNVYVQDIKELE